MDITLPMIARRAGHAGSGSCSSSPLAQLTRINLDDLVAAFGWSDHPVLAGVARTLLGRPARRFAHQILEFDAAIRTEGLAGAARRSLSRYVRDVQVIGAENIPDGPFLALSNHPGLADALSVFAALDRPDLRVIALERPFLQALPHTSKHLSCLSGAPSSCGRVIRAISAHLRAGGAALSFPAGRIEPDPDLRDGGEESLKSWASSADVFTRLAPEAAVLPVLVRGVVWPATYAPLGGSRGAAADRDKAAAALQLLAHVGLKLKPVSVTVQVGAPIYPRAEQKQGLHAEVVAAMTGMIRAVPAR